MIDLAAWMLFMMLAGHALADGPLQSDALAAAKRRWGPDPVRAPQHVPAQRWGQALLVHGLIHGGLVALITQMWWLGLAETLLHIAIDDAKGTGKISHFTDQALHFACKLLWVVLAVREMMP